MIALTKWYLWLFQVHAAIAESYWVIDIVSLFMQQIDAILCFCWSKVWEKVVFVPMQKNPMRVCVVRTGGCSGSAWILTS